MEYDRERVIERLFDPDMAPVLAELEGGTVSAPDLTEKTGLSAEDLEEKLDYLIMCGFIIRHAGPPTAYSADAEKLGHIMEDDENYQSAMDGLTKLDGFLN